ncbi:MAG: ABC transporter ATP-binding protein [Trueperaceae bacterium]|nr:ABC transporter ATP-binding protein [Trueperaceae bacterium]
MKDDVVVDARALTRRFGETVAVDALDLRVRRAEIVGMLGHNGAGKTTTVRLLNGVLAATGGSATVLGLDPWRDGVRLRRRTGVATETPAVDDRLTGREGLTFFARIYGVPEVGLARRVDEVLGIFDLVDAADERVGGYSRGMKQRLSLARTLVHGPELLFLDEPTAGLDPVAARALDDQVRTLRASGATVLLCTHNLVQAQALCDRVVVLERGRVVAEGTPAELARALAKGGHVVIDVEAGDSVDPITVLRRVPGLRSVEAHDAIAGDGARRLRMQADDRAAVATAVDALVRANVRVFAVEPEAPGLEDVYFALHERARSVVAPPTPPAAAGVES